MSRNLPRCSTLVASTVALIALSGIAPATPVAGAQVTSASWPPIWSLGPGDTVRVWASAPPLSGRTALVARVGSDTLALGLPGRQSLAPMAVPFRTLTRVEVQRGYSRSLGWALTGVVIGVAGGALIGSLAGVTLECGGSCSDEGEFAGIAGVVIGGGLGALAGAITGGVIGSRKRPRWRPVALPAR